MCDFLANIKTVKFMYSDLQRFMSYKSLQIEQYINDNDIDLPMTTILTPLPGTKLHQEIKSKIKSLNMMKMV